MLLPARTLRFCVATAAAAIAVTVGLTGCGSDDDSGSATGTTATASTTTTASATTGSGQAAGATPSVEELQTTLAILSDPAKTTQDKVAIVVDGEKRATNIESMTKALAGYGTLKFVVSDVKVTGDTATAQVVISSPNGDAPPMPLTWQQVGGKWKLSDASACVLLGFAQAPCTP
ncbi:nuclear transport factor 2 family protein [Nocardia aurea]|uniref:nuclear transport factor 2 family protein n=1 Tax=Nocardia aurea TaxID=2144174 RepID=UPI00339FA9F9